MTLRAALLAIVVSITALSAARAETLFLAASSERVSITSNFTGTEITVFGAVERDAFTVSREGPYHIALVVTGPRKTAVTRRKQRVAGIWINRQSRTYVDVPDFYTVSTSGAISEIATPGLISQLQLGMDNLILPEAVAGGVEVLAGDQDFRLAFLRLKRRSGLYREFVGAVEFATDEVFRTTLPLPANVPIGRYEVTAYLLRDQALLAQAQVFFTVTKSGFEQWLFEFAFDDPWLYGIATVLMALATGWLAGIIFRRD